MLSDHLKLSADIYEDYDIGEHEIMPISKIDAEIIDLIIEVMSKKNEVELLDILREWKSKEDQEIYDKLLTFSNSIKKQVFPPRNFININNQVIIDVKFVLSISKSDSYDFDNNVPVYNIIVNEDSQERVVCCNKIAKFNSFIERERELDRLKEVLKDMNIHFL